VVASFSSLTWTIDTSIDEVRALKGHQDCVTVVSDIDRGKPPDIIDG
jgi:hypothetical protein